MRPDIEVEDLWLRYPTPSRRRRSHFTASQRSKREPRDGYGYRDPGRFPHRLLGYLGLRRLPVTSSPDALRGLSFALEGNKIYGLLGSNGAGKTTLLSLLAGYRRPTSGHLRIGGQPVYENPRVLSRVCLVGTGDAMLDQEGTVKQAVALAACLRPSFDAGYADGLLERFDLGNTRVAKLSRGGQAALRIVLGLASRAPVTMFDEVHLGLDVPKRKLFYDELLADFMAHPRTIIVSTHLIKEVSRLLEEVVIIDRGCLVVHDNAEDLRARGASVTGPAAAVDRFVDGRTTLSEKRLGPTKSVMVYGPVGDADSIAGRAAGLELGPVALEDLFVHLTEGGWR